MKMKWKVFVGLLSLFIATALQVAPAHAATPYDTTVNPTTELHLRVKNGTDVSWDSGDISKTWMQYVDDPTYGCPADVIADYEQALSDGYWAIVQRHQWSYDWVNIWWTHDPTQTGTFSTDVNGHSWLYVNFDGMMSIDTNYTGYHPHCSGYIVQDGPGGPAPLSSSYRDPTNLTEEVYSATYPIDYPEGYAGDYVPSLPSGPLTTIYNGSIDCGNDTLSYLLITQDGVTNPVALTYTSDYTANWSYSLTDNPYFITAGCGDTVAASYGSVTPMPPTSNNWICDTVDDPHYCVLD